MGDNQYDDARLSDFRNYYDKTWGAFKAKPAPCRATTRPTTRPVPSPATGPTSVDRLPAGQAYYSFDQGNWHFIALDSNAFDRRAQMTG